MEFTDTGPIKLTQDDAAEMAERDPRELLALLRRWRRLAASAIFNAAEEAGHLDEPADADAFRAVLEEILAHHESPVARQGAAAGLANFLPDSRGALARALEDPHPGVRQAAKNSLALL